MAYQARGRDPLFDSTTQEALQKRGKELVGVVLTLAACAHADLNRFAMGFCAECLRRLAHTGKLACAAAALQEFVASPRWKPPELAGHLRLSQDRYDYDQGLFVSS